MGDLSLPVEITGRNHQSLPAPIATAVVTVAVTFNRTNHSSCQVTPPGVQSRRGRDYELLQITQHSAINILDAAKI